MRARVNVVEFYRQPPDHHYLNQVLRLMKIEDLLVRDVFVEACAERGKKCEK